MSNDLRARFAELRAEERRTIPSFAVVAPASRRPYWRRPAAAFALLLIVCIVLSIRPRHTTFTPDDRAAARAIATWHPPTDFLLRMPSTGVSR
jgi:hypothetical protein